MDIKLHYMEKGTGESLILLHGNGENLHYFAHQIDYFAKKYHVIAVDTRGHGHSPRGTAPFSIRQFAEDLYDFMDERWIEQANLLGFSDGGNIALVFALKYPEKVKNLIIDGANLDTDGVKASVQIPIELGYYTAKLFSGKSRKAKQRAEMLGLMVNDPKIRPEELESLKVRTLVMAGTRDLIKEEHTKMMAHKIPNARLAFVEGGHGIAAENPKTFNRVVEQFLTESES